MTTVREQILDALQRAVEEAVNTLGPGLVQGRNAQLPRRVPECGLVTLQDGDAGEPIMTIGRSREYHHEQTATLVVLLQESHDKRRAFGVDDLFEAVSHRVERDRTLGIADRSVVAMCRTPTVEHDGLEGGTTLVHGQLPIMFQYVSGSPIG